MIEERERLLDLLVHGVRLRRLAGRLESVARRIEGAAGGEAVARLAGSLDAARARLRMDLFSALPPGTAVPAVALVAGPWEVAVAGQGVAEIFGPRSDLAGFVAERIGGSVSPVALESLLEPREGRSAAEGVPVAGLLLENGGRRALVLVEDIPRKLEVVTAPLGRLLGSHPLVRGVAVDPGGSLLPLLGVGPLVDAAAR